ncbi:MAG: outer-membrane lipoprotein carrier protein LolA [Pseudomonadota bacterium]
MKKRFYLSIMITAIMLASLGLVSVSSLAAEAEDILAEIQKKYQDVTGLSADYVRVTQTPAMEGLFKSTSTNTASGLILFKKPAKLILNQAQPRTENLVTDGQTVWWYIPDENLVHQYSKVDVYGELKPLLDFLGGLGGLKGEFKVQVTPAGTGGETTHRLDLERLKPGSGPASITVWCDPRTNDLTAFQFKSLTGETTTFTLNHVQLNPGLNDTLFVFRVPPGAEVVEEEGGM